MSINKIQTGDVLSKSKELVEENIEKLKSLFPEITTEGKIDFKVLQEILGEEVEEEDEYYRLTWAGKSKARREAHKPSTGTLRPAEDESVDWDNTQNLYIEGDNLEVLKLMQKSYAGKVKMIYIDPPYNTGNDFVYKDNYKDNLKNYQELTGQLDEKGNRLSTNSESDGRFHSNWLNMMYPRLKLARNVLKEDGIIFISIDDHEFSTLKRLCDEIFGETNFISCLIWDTNHSAQAGVFKVYHQYILVYAKNIDNVKTPKALDNHLFEAGAMKRQSKRHPMKKFKFPKGTRFDAEDGTELKETWGGAEKVILHEGRMIAKKKRLVEDVVIEAAFTQGNQMEQFFYGDRDSLIDSRGQKVKEFYFTGSGKVKIVKERSVSTPQTTRKYSTQGTISKKLAELFELSSTPLDSPKPVEMVQEFAAWFLSEDEVVLDFFSGSATTAESIFTLNALDNGNRSFILVQLPELTDEDSEAFKAGYTNICEIGKERIRRAAKKISNENPDKAQDLDLGFKVFKLDSSNIQTWDGDPSNLEQSLFEAQENIKTDRGDEDVMYEILLKYGLDLTLPIEEKEIAGQRVFNVGMGALFICLSDKITTQVAQGIGKWKEDLQPATCRVIFKDSGFNDVEKTNCSQILKGYGIEEVKSI